MLEAMEHAFAAATGVGSISIGVFEGTVHEDGLPVRLSASEARFLMLTAARYAGLGVPVIPVGAQTRVLVNRIRERFNAPVLVSAGSGRYVLTPNVRVDLVQMHLGREYDELSLRLAIRRLTANPFRTAPWFLGLEPQLLDLAREFLERATAKTCNTSVTTSNL